jgi:hypothetical protein
MAPFSTARRSRTRTRDGSARGSRVVTVREGSAYGRQGDTFTIDPARRDHHDALLRALKQEDALPGRIVSLWAASPAGGSRAPAGALDASASAASELDVTRAFWPLLFLLQAAGASGSVAGMRMVAVANGLFDVTGETPAGPGRALLSGICRVAMQEYEGLVCRLVDAQGGGPPADEGSLGTSVPAAAIAARIASELDAEDREPLVAWRGGHRWVPSYTRVPLPAPVDPPPGIRAGGVYVITGGAGPLEIAIAARLASSGVARPFRSPATARLPRRSHPCARRASRSTSRTWAWPIRTPSLR